MTNTHDANKYLLSREAIEDAMERPPVIGEREPWGHLIGVVVGGSVARPNTIATHMRIIGTGGRLATDRRRVETMDVPLCSPTFDLEYLARRLLDYVADLANVTIAVDPLGLGTYFLKLLNELAPGTRTAVAGFGGVPTRQDSAARFATRRAQAYVHTAEGLRDGVVRINHMQDTLVKQGSNQAYSLDAQGRYHMGADSHGGVPRGRVDMFDTLAMAFLDDVGYAPAAVQATTDNKTQKLARIEQDALRGIGASSGDTLRLVAEVAEYRRLKADFDNIPSRRAGR